MFPECSLNLTTMRRISPPGSHVGGCVGRQQVDDSEYKKNTRPEAASECTTCSTSRVIG
jgi:hypothetical protein